MSKILANYVTGAALKRPNYVIKNVVKSLSSSPEWVPKEQVTHTGQKWDEDDKRLARYVGKTKLVNPNFAIKLIDEIPPKACKESVVWCDGGSGPTGHPKVYINLDKPGNHACGYCGLRFYLDHSH